MNDYIEKNFPVLKLIVQSQWDFVSFTEVQRYFDLNFKNDLEGKYYCLKIFLHLLYYSKKDIIALLKHGLHEKVFGDSYRNKLVADKNIYPGVTDNIAYINEFKKDTFFCPIEDNNKPCESGNAVIADIVNNLEIEETNVDFQYNVTAEKLKNKKALVFVDDCIGSGSQIKSFFNSENVDRLIALAKEAEVPIFCLLLVGYGKNIQKASRALAAKGIKLVVCEELTEKHRIFSKENVVWTDEEELQGALDFFGRIQREKGMGYLGFKKLDFALILHDRTPNWSLPILWKSYIGWQILIKRKTS